LGVIDSICLQYENRDDALPSCLSVSIATQSVSKAINMQINWMKKRRNAQSRSSAVKLQTQALRCERTERRFCAELFQNC
jgi:hypothetical protein